MPNVFSISIVRFRIFNATYSKSPYNGNFFGDELVSRFFCKAQYFSRRHFFSLPFQVKNADNLCIEISFPVKLCNFLVRKKHINIVVNSNMSLKSLKRSCSFIKFY